MPTAPGMPRAPGSGTAAVTEPLLSALKALIGAGRTIEAIKRYRLATGADLVTAKGVVDALAAGRPPSAAATSVDTQPLPRLRWQVQAVVPFTTAKAAGVLRLLALFFWLCASLAAVAAGWQAYERDTIRQSWAQTNAEVVRCRLVDHQTRRRTFNLWTLKEVGPTFSLACRFRYGVDGRDYTAETRSHSTYVEYLTAAMGQWVNDHEPGSRQMIYYDPSNPQNISLGDADAGFEPDSTEHRLQLALMFGGGGVVLFGGGLWLAAVQRRRDLSAGV